MGNRFILYATHCDFTYSFFSRMRCIACYVRQNKSIKASNIIQELGYRNFYKFIIYYVQMVN